MSEYHLTATKAGCDPRIGIGFHTSNWLVTLGQDHELSCYMDEWELHEVLNGGSVPDPADE